jgi:hypothetical protein
MNRQNFQKKIFFKKIMSFKKPIVPSDSHLGMIFFLSMVYQTLLVQESTRFYI